MERPLLTQLYTLALIFITTLNALPQDITGRHDPRVLIMQETGEYRDGLPVMIALPETDPLFGQVHGSIRNSFLARFLDLYELCQCYLMGEGELQEIEPAYLALTDHQGGYAKQGFILQTQEKELVKAETPYVDITVQSATRDMAGLMSVTQLFPHEMAHVIFRLLSPEDSLAYNSRSVDMHYFSIITDYPTAFNEGFAEHMENVARHFEENDSIRSGIEEDLKRIEESSGHAIDGFTRDFTHPFRMGFYKAGMINWYQKYEDYKRSEHAISGRVRFKNKSLALKNVEDRLSYRNAGLEEEDAVRNTVQFHSTEGAISAFFTALSLREEKNFTLSDSIFEGLCKEKLTEPDQLQIQFLKYFHVMHHYVVHNNSSTSQFSDFIRGYVESFPEDKTDVLNIYRDLTGQEFTPDLPESIWLMITDHQHRLLVLDPFGAIEVPLYTFNLNAAEVDDLLTIDGLTEEQAEAIIHYRDNRGFFEDLEDLSEVPQLSAGTVEMISKHAFDQTEFERIMDGYQPELNIITLLITPLLHVLSKALLYFILIFTLILFLLKSLDKLQAGSIFRVSLRYLALWLGIVLLELFLLFLFPQSWGLALLPMILVLTGTLIIFRNKKEKRNFTLYVLALMFLFSIASVL